MSAYDNAEAYVSDMALSSIWGDDMDAPVPDERIHALAGFYDLVRMNVQELVGKTGLNQAQLAKRFSIPYRTVQNWMAPDTERGHRECPLYVRLMMAECLGLLPFEITG